MVKIICAGYPKTGTKTMTKALRILGYKVYDIEESIQYGLNEWVKILNDESQDIDGLLDRIYTDDVEVVVDMPHTIFFEYFHRKWPDAKVILTLREENADWKSYNKMMEWNKTRHTEAFLWLVWLISPTGKKMLTFNKYLHNMFMGTSDMNEMKYKIGMRRHNAYVRATIPSELLFEYQVTEGWEPLCRFLNKPVPKKPFPWAHKFGGKDMLFTRLTEMPVGQKIFTDVKNVMLGLFILILGVICWYYF